MPSPYRKILMYASNENSIIQGELVFFLTIEVLPIYMLCLYRSLAQYLRDLGATMPAYLEGMRASANGAGGALSGRKRQTCYASRPISLAMRSE